MSGYSNGPAALPLTDRPPECRLAVHVAILASPYDQMVVDGRKRIESRLTKGPRPPFGAVTPGDVVYIKRSAGPFVARAEAARVLMADQLTPEAIDELVKRYNRWIGGNDDYWRAKRSCRYATLIWLRNIDLVSVGPRYRVQHMRAWYVLGDEADPARASERFEVPVTAGALRRDYLSVRSAADRLPRTEKIMLQMDGRSVPLRYDRVKQMIRGAALGRWMAEQQLNDGDRVALEPNGNGTFLASPIHMK